MKKDRDHHCPTCGKPLPTGIGGYRYADYCNKVCEIQWKSRGRVSRGAGRNERPKGR